MECPIKRGYDTKFVFAVLIKRWKIKRKYQVFIGENHRVKIVLHLLYESLHIKYWTGVNKGAGLMYIPIEC